MNFDVPREVLLTPELPAATPCEHGAEIVFSEQLRAVYRADQHALYSRWAPLPRPCFNPRLLADLRAYTNFVANSGGVFEHGGEAGPIEYVVVASDAPGVFNLGGDLDLFTQLIFARDRAGLLRYGRACIDVLHPNYCGYGLPVTTVSLVQGEALGGGFECALSSDVIVAEKSARMGFPEILFNLFPGMGAYSFLDRRVGQKSAEAIITSGQIYTAEQMHAMGVVDVVCEDGEGATALADLIRKRRRSQNGIAATAAARRRVHRLEFSELMDVVEIWVDAALRLNPVDLKLMQRLVKRQNQLGEAAAAGTLH
ncbi:MAG: crotonase/enoyl-CoA hydratase family protein [Burkholderiales bacterium]